MKCIEKYKNKTEALVKSYMQLNDKSTKRSSVRMMQLTGAIDKDIDPAAYLETQDIGYGIMDVDLDEIQEE